MTNGDDGTVSVISTATNNVTATVTVGSLPVAVAVTSDGAFAYVTNADDGTVSVINTSAATSPPSPTPIATPTPSTPETTLTPTASPLSSTGATTSPSPTVSEFPAQAALTALIISMIAFLFAVTVAKKRRAVKIQHNQHS